ncbi:MAG: TlpA family protein disulfide reductase [Woeseiaceae bacterium]
MQKTIAVIVALIAVAVGGVFFYTNNHRVPEPAPVAAAADPDAPIKVAFELNDLENNKRSFSEWDGKHRIVNFWATWCAPCRREIPLLKAFQEEYGADDFQVIGIAVEFLEPVVAYAEDAEFNYQILYGELDAMEVAESSGISFVGLPFTMIVAKDGTLVGAHMGEIHQEHLDNIVTVMGQLDRGEVDIPGARDALNLM